MLQAQPNLAKCDLADDLSAFVSQRKYVTVAMPGGQYVRLQSLTAGELRTIKQSDDQVATAIVLCWVNDKGHRTHTLEDRSRVQQMDSKAYDTLETAIQNFCLNNKSLDEIIKKLD